MTLPKGTRISLWAAFFALIITLGLPAAAQAQGRGHGRGQAKKAEKFKNGHDARDGRWDGRGPRDNRDDDDDWRDRNRGRNRRDRDQNGYDRNEIRRVALDAGYQEGVRAGRTDRANGERFDYQDESVFQDATIGYQSSYGDVNFYRQQFRVAFRQGYEDGYRNRSSRGGWRDTLGGIFGRP